MGSRGARLKVAMLVMASLCSGVGCESQEVKDPWQEYSTLKSGAEAKGEALVTFKNGEKIHTAEFEHFWQTHPAYSRQEAINALIEQKMMLFDAQERTPSPEDTRALKAALSRGWADAWLEAFNLEHQEIDTSSKEYKANVEAETLILSKPEAFVVDVLKVMPVEGKCSKEQAGKITKELHKELEGLNKPLDRRDFLLIEERTRGEVDGCQVFSPKTWRYTTSHYPVELLPSGWAILPDHLVKKFHTALKDPKGITLVEPVINLEGGNIFAPQRLQEGKPGDVARAKARVERRMLNIKRAPQFGSAIKKLLDGMAIELEADNLDDTSGLPLGGSASPSEKGTSP